MSKIRPSPLPPLGPGIEHVVHESRATTDLPLGLDVLPAETRAGSQLEQLLALPNIDEFIAAELLPKLSNFEMLAPAHFAAVLAAVEPQLRGAAERHPRAARALGRLARLLSDETALRDLLYMYRTALVQG